MGHRSLFDDPTLKPIQRALTDLLEQGAEAIHWHDPEGEFSAMLDRLEVPGLEVIRADAPVLELKRRLCGPPGRPFLLYTVGPEPAPSADAFLDVKCYARRFRADVASLKLAELGLGGRPELVGWAERRKSFLGSADRTSRLRERLDPRDSEADLDRKAIAVLVRAPSAERRDVLMAALGSLDSLDSTPEFYPHLERFGLLDAFWRMVEEQFREDRSNLEPLGEGVGRFRRLLLRLFASDLWRACPSKELGRSVADLRLPDPNPATVFLSQWRDSESLRRNYMVLSREAEERLKVQDAIANVTIDELKDAETFEMVDQRILVGIRDELLVGPTEERRSELLELIQRRSATYWPRQTPLASCYEGLREAIGLLSALASFEERLPRVPPKDLARVYLEDWHQIDSAYRRFSVHAQKASEANFEALKPVAEGIEDAYNEGFLARLGARWSEALDQGLLETWRIDGAASQRRFFEEQVKAALTDGLKRIFVIVSDALRYEAGTELAERLRAYRYATSVKPMLGVLPSTTLFGMAALLPHERLELVEGPRLLADSRPTDGLEGRKAILASQRGLAVGAQDLLAMKRDEGRALVRDAQVVYVYHNAIDAVGDKADTESGTFRAVDRGLSELEQLVRRIVDQLNGSTVIVTADHGFLYTERSPTEVERTSLGELGDGALIAKKRLVVGRNLPSDGPFHRAPLAATAGVDGDWVGIYPRSTQRFHLAGGARYVHGGPMPQEVFVPVVTVKEKDGEAADRTKVQPVGIALATHTRRVTVSQMTWKFYQTEAVDERHKALRATVGIYDEGRLVSDLQTVVFDADTNSLESRERRVRLTMSNETFDRRRTYRLVVRNADDGTEVLSEDLTVDIAFTDEF